MIISQDGWVTDIDNKLTSMSYENCSCCNSSLSEWYVNILNKLKSFLPKNYQKICCKCAFANALCMPKKCPNCHSLKVEAGWILGTFRGEALLFWKPAFWCRECSWNLMFNKKQVEEKISEYLANLW